MTENNVAPAPVAEEEPPAPTGPLSREFLDANGLEYVEATNQYRFTTTRNITVEIFDRGLDGGKTPAENNKWTDWIKEGVLRDHNIAVTFVPVDRFSENERINDLLASGTAPDVSYTYNYPAVQTYANMGGITDLAPYFADNSPINEAIWAFLGGAFINFDKNPQTGELWAIEGKRTGPEVAGLNTFIRQDWLDQLGLKSPTNLDEFHTVLVAFKDNAKTLLGDDAGKIIPYAVSFDVGWNARHLALSFAPDAITDKDTYVYGFDDRRLLYPDKAGNVGGAWKEAAKVLNQWYNEGLLWSDFALYGSGDATYDNYIKAGYVGSFGQSWDYAYRDGENGITGQLHSLIGPDANFVAIETFKNDAGLYLKDINLSPTDRKTYLPATNKEPLASIMYINWMNRPENYTFMQKGIEGVTHRVLDGGVIQLIPADDPAYDPEWIQNAVRNIDYTMQMNGLNYGDTEVTMKSVALNYAGVAPELITRAYDVAVHDGRGVKGVNLGPVLAEDGMGTPLQAKRDTLLANAVACKPDQFDSVWDSGFADYLSSGGQDIINERLQKWEAALGTATMLE